MLKRDKLGNAIFWALAAGATTTSVNAQDQDQNNDAENANPREIETMVVTATKTEETDIQQTAVAVGAISGDELDQLGIANLQDIVQFSPNITDGSRGPGQSTVFMRGMSIQPITVLLSGAQGTNPNVAIYLDEQPVTAPGRNLDVYSTDLKRVEVLAGPQGTLFGASSQAGTIRYITNKPEFSGFDAGFDARLSKTEDGETSTAVEGFVNLPINDQMAGRIAFYNDDQGGYIDNVEGTFTLDPQINPNSAVAGVVGPDATFTEANNANLAEEDFNDASYRGVRASFTYQINPDWSILIQDQYQKLEADGVFDFDPTVGDLDVERFFKDELEDTFNQIAWTVEGRLGLLNVVYTGAYLDRQIDQSVDYTGYNETGAYIAYYTCTYSIEYGTDNPFVTGDTSTLTENRQCLDPTKGAIIDQNHSRNTHEFRFSTPQDWRLRFTGGFFYDDFEIKTQDDFHYFANMDGGGAALGFAPNAPIPEANNINPDVRPDTVAFFNDITRTEEQYAFFGEASFDLIPNYLTLNAGGRFWFIDSDFTGSSNFANGIFNGSAEPPQRGRDYDVSGGHTPEPFEQDGFDPRLTVSWTPLDDVLLYGTYSTGFRPGGFNRGGGLASVNPEFPTVNTTYETDNVRNLELGWKTLLFNRTVRFNGNAYYIEWDDMQVSRFDPQNVSILTFIENAADSEIWGVESDVTWQATEHLTLMGSISFNDTELTAIDAQIVELVPVGSELALTPTFQAAFRGRYEWDVAADWADYAYVTADAQYTGDSFSSIVAEERREQDSYAVGGMSFGMQKEQWGLELFVDNIGDTRAEVFINTQDDIERTTTIRPRTFGFELSYRHLPF